MTCGLHSARYMLYCRPPLQTSLPLLLSRQLLIIKFTMNYEALCSSIDYSSTLSDTDIDLLGALHRGCAIPAACNGNGKLVSRCSCKACSRVVRCCSSCCFNILRFSWMVALSLMRGQTGEGRCAMCLKVMLLCELPPPAVHAFQMQNCLSRIYSHS